MLLLYKITAMWLGECFKKYLTHRLHGNVLKTAKNTPIIVISQISTYQHATKTLRAPHQLHKCSLLATT